MITTKDGRITPRTRRDLEEYLENLYQVAIDNTQPKRAQSAYEYILELLDK